MTGIPEIAKKACLKFVQYLGTGTSKRQQVSQGKHCFVKYSQILKNSKPLYNGNLVMAYRIIELCKFIVCFVLQNSFRMLYLSRAKLCLNLISSVKLWVVLKFYCIAVGYISKQNRIKARLNLLRTKQIIFNFDVGLFHWVT